MVATPVIFGIPERLLEAMDTDRAKWSAKSVGEF
jgi:hypothetical protein